jgi:hypothetical protein
MIMVRRLKIGADFGIWVGLDDWAGITRLLTLILYSCKSPPLSNQLFSVSSSLIARLYRSWPVFSARLSIPFR